MCEFFFRKNSHIEGIQNTEFRIQNSALRIYNDALNLREAFY
jgi:hypothetical protein